jgi:hypothetical protein
MAKLFRQILNEIACDIRPFIVHTIVGIVMIAGVYYYVPFYVTVVKRLYPSAAVERIDGAAIIGILVAYGVSVATHLAFASYARSRELLDIRKRLKDTEKLVYDDVESDVAYLLEDARHGGTAAGRS